MDAARCVAGVQLAPPSVIFPSTGLPLVSSTLTSVSLPLAAVTFSAPLVFTAAAPSFGAMVTTACETLVSAWLDPLSLPFPEPDLESDESPLPAARGDDEQQYAQQQRQSSFAPARVARQPTPPISVARSRSFSPRTA